MRIYLHSGQGVVGLMLTILHADTPLPRLDNAVPVAGAFVRVMVVDTHDGARLRHGCTLHVALTTGLNRLKMKCIPKRRNDSYNELDMLAVSDGDTLLQNIDPSGTINNKDGYI